MSAPEQNLVCNRLLAFLSDEDYRLLRPHLERVVFTRGQILLEPHQPCVNLHFLESGLASQIAVTSDNRRLEVGIYGRDGMGPTANVLGVDSTPHQLIIQVEGHGFSIPAKIFIDLLDQSRTLRALILRYVQAFTVQTGCTALSHGSALIGERLARWLLMCHDRIDGDDLHLTHEFLGIMLGVRRSGVTDAMHLLEGVNIIRRRAGTFAFWIGKNWRKPPEIVTGFPKPNIGVS